VIRLSTAALLMAGFASIATAVDVNSVGSNATKPNVIVFLSDDVGWGEFGFQGCNDIPTPNIDSIAKNGVKFTSGYVAATVCSPSRAGLMTGRYPTRFGHEFNGGDDQGRPNNLTFGLPLTEILFPQRMKALGYATCCIGKWHLGDEQAHLPMARGFDEFFGSVANSPFFQPSQFIDSRKSNKVDPVTDENFYTTDAYKERAIDWMGQQAGKPYFLYVPFNAQHGPLQATQNYLDRFPGLQRNRKIFAAMMSAMDDAVGAILAKVRDLGQEENTLIFFLSDNGGPTQFTTSKNTPLRGLKAQTSEGGTRIPFCMQWKGTIHVGQTYDFPIQNLDVLPTALTAAGGKVDPAWKLDGVDLIPYVTGTNKGRPHETLFWRYGPQWAIRKGDWKLVVSQFDELKPRLINLAEDISESNDLSDQNPEKVRELTAVYKAWSEEQHEPLWGPLTTGLQKKKSNNNK
jgi:arylsulfatase A-like enzyme